MQRQTKAAFSYIRFSDRKQAKGDSLRRQLEWAPALCAGKGWVLDGELKLHDLGVSAFRGKNAAMGALAGFLAAVKAGKVPPGSVLLLEALDRLTRADIDAGWKLFRSVLKAGVEIYTREPERHYLPKDLHDFGTRIEVMAYMLRAHNESATKSMRSAAFWQKQRTLLTAEEGKRKKIHQVVPAWLRLSQDRTRFEVIPEAAAAIRLIYKWAGEGLGLNPITARLNQEGVPPIGNNIRRRPDVFKDSWRRSYVAKLLADKAVVGEFQPHKMQMVPADPSDPDGPARQKRVPQGDPIPDYFPVVIPENEWYRVRQAVKERGRELGPKGVGIASLFTGLIFDARDGKTMHLTYTGSSRKANTRVLVSYGSRNGEPGSPQRMHFPYDIVEKYFLATVRELKASDILDGNADNHEQEIMALAGKLQDLDRKIAAVQKRALENEGIDTLLTLLEGLDKEKKATAARLERLKGEAAQRQPSALADTQGLIDLLAKSEGEERKLLRTKIKARIRQLVESLWVLVWDPTTAIRAAEVQVVFRGGKVRLLSLAWLRRGKHRGLGTGVGLVVAEPGKSSHLADKRLSAYRDHAATRKYFDAHLANVGPAIEEAVAAEVKIRECMAAAKRFGLGTPDDPGPETDVGPGRDTPLPKAARRPRKAARQAAG
jgi:hypothetical protein